MIYTITFNPALDYVVGLEKFIPGGTNRTAYDMLQVGGKGLNVSTVLNNLSLKNIAMGFIAGFTGHEIEKRFSEAGGNSDFIMLPNGESRINIKIKADIETEINAYGPEIDSDSLSKLMLKIEQLNSGDILVLAGSIPPSLPDSLYSDILKALQDKNVLCVVDATKDLMLNVLPYRPFLIKPNNHELGELFGVELKTHDDVIPYAKKLIERGAKNVLVSMAGEGAVMVSEDGSIYKANAPKGKVRNSVGAGDSMVAGFIAGYCESGRLDVAFRMGLASGSASAFSDELASKEEILTLLKKIETF